MFTVAPMFVSCRTEVYDAPTANAIIITFKIGFSFLHYRAQAILYCIRHTTGHIILYTSHYRPYYTVYVTLQAILYCIRHTTGHIILYTLHYRPYYTVYVTLQAILYCIRHTTGHIILYTLHNRPYYTVYITLQAILYCIRWAGSFTSPGIDIQ